MQAISSFFMRHAKAVHGVFMTSDQATQIKSLGLLLGIYASVFLAAFLLLGARKKTTLFLSLPVVSLIIFSLTLPLFGLMSKKLVEDAKGNKKMPAPIRIEKKLAPEPAKLPFVHPKLPEKEKKEVEKKAKKPRPKQKKVKTLKVPKTFQKRFLRMWHPVDIILAFVFFVVAIYLLLFKKSNKSAQRDRRMRFRDRRKRRREQLLDRREVQQENVLQQTFQKFESIIYPEQFQCLEVIDGALVITYVIPDTGFKAPAFSQQLTNQNIEKWRKKFTPKSPQIQKGGFIVFALAILAATIYAILKLSKGLSSSSKKIQQEVSNELQKKSTQPEKKPKKNPNKKPPPSLKTPKKTDQKMVDKKTKSDKGELQATTAAAKEVYSGSTFKARCATFAAISRGDFEDFLRLVSSFGGNLELTGNTFFRYDKGGSGDRKTLLQKAVYPDHFPHGSRPSDETRHGRLKIAKWLIENGAMVERKFNYGGHYRASLLAMASFANDTEMLDLLLENGEFHQWELDMALIIACCGTRPYLAIAQKLVAAGADTFVEVPEDFGTEFGENMDPITAKMLAKKGLFSHYHAHGYTISVNDTVMPEGCEEREEKKKIIAWIGGE